MPFGGTFQHGFGRHRFRRPVTQFVGNVLSVDMATRKYIMASTKLRKKSRKITEDPLVVFCRSLPGATEDVKWGKDLIFSVGGRMFAGFPLPGGDPIGFKVDPHMFASLVGHKGVVPAPYMAKHSWVSVTDRNKLPLRTLKELLGDSHRLVAANLSMRARKTLGIP